MSTISIRKTKEPMHNVFAFVPGERINIHVKFGEQIPDHYRLQVLDHRNNSRLNRYGKGSNKGIILDWPIPHTIRNEHLGVWRIQVEADTETFGQHFYVEHKERIDPPMLFAATSPLELLEEQGIPLPVPEVRILASKISVIAIKGIGKTYASRLVKIQVFTISEFLDYPDRVSLAEVMRISDTKLIHMLQDAEFLISKEVERPDEDVTIPPSDLLSIKGIGSKSVERLAKLGITSKLDLENFDDLEALRKTLRMSMSRLSKVLSSIGKSIVLPEVIEPETIDPFAQPVTSIKGIGVKTAQKLNQRGIMTVKDLLDSSFTLFEDSTSENTYNKWKKSATIFISQKPDGITPPTRIPADGAQLTSISGVGVKTAQRLNTVGVLTLKDLVEYELEELARKTRFSKKRLSTWRVQAKGLLGHFH
ncbi:MAG: helix-hairpin-helix domain-containing protein [Promethearchaeota archaeon]